MKPDSDAMRLLLERLLGNGDAWFTAAELDAALSWLSGSERHGGDALASRIGPALEQPGRRIAVYDRLSAQLFRNGQLDLPGAHVDIDIDIELRRARYRRLMTAFHPDRFPAHAGWLTSRSQAVLASYGRFRRGEPPENRRPDAAPDHKPKSEARVRPGWSRDRRSARLTPVAGPGPLARLRTWLLGIENLQRRILLVLAVLCLVPVLYAYLVYKPYRDIHTPAPELADSGAGAYSVSSAQSRPTAKETAPDAQSVEQAVLAHNTRREMPEILPSWHRDRTTNPSVSPDPGAGSSAADLVDTQQKSLPESPDLQGNAAGQPEQPRQSARPDPAAPTSSPTDHLSSTMTAGSPTDSRSREPMQSARDTPIAEPGPTAERSTPPEPGSAQEPLSDEPALADAESAPRAGQSLSTRSAEVAEAAAALDQQRREHIQDLLAGYRTSFENGWLEEFLKYFTATPRENSHQGRDWFRSNYGWLFENTAERELNIDILDMTGAGDHWIVLARFEMRVDYPDRPTTRSARQVRYRIETNEHDQFRIAAIEY